ncbi:MAG TPA: transglycosylase SLT domain-containing protein [Noviherbaspirillum sp.]
MSINTKLPVTWQDYANLWGNDPRYRQQYETIKPTLIALGITPQDIDNPPAGNDKNPPTPNSLYTVGGDDDSNWTPLPGNDSTLGPGLPPQAEKYREIIEQVSRITGVPASLLAAKIHAESRWDAGAATNNPGGDADTGLMQIGDDEFRAMQGKHPELQGLSKNDPFANILAGAFYLLEMREKMIEKYGRSDWEIALRAYNSGENGVNPNDLSSLPAGTGTAQHVQWVMDFWRNIEEGGTLPP